MVKTFASVVVLISLVVAPLTGCAPRGETKSLEEVFQIAKRRYEQSMSATKASSEKKEQVVELVSNLDSFVAADGSSQMRSLGGEIAGQLQGLISSTGYTTRPALNELTKAFRAVGDPEGREKVLGEDAPDGVKMDAAARKLLVARSFTALAQELETTSFQVEKAGV